MDSIFTGIVGVNISDGATVKRCSGISPHAQLIERFVLSRIDVSLGQALDYLSANSKYFLPAFE